LTDGFSIGLNKMPSNLAATTHLGEISLLQIALRAMDHERLSRSDQEPDALVGRHVWLNESQLRHRNAVVDLVAVAENFTSSRLVQLRPNLTENDVFTWERRRRAWAEHGSVDLETVTPDWLALQGFIEARNALQHGLGRLTDFQLDRRRREETLRRLRAAAIYLSGDFVHIHVETVHRCHDVCKSYVLALDEAAASP
jgi:hypothetical protein